MSRPAAAAALLGVLLLTGCGASSQPHSAALVSTPPGPQSARPASTPPSVSSTPPPSTVSILGSGDVLIHPPLWQQAHADAGGDGYDFGPMYASVAPDTRAADVAICELETPLAAPSGPFVGWPDFSAPPQVLTALKGVGYDSCTTASNHTLDQGYDGLKRTLDEVDAAGLRHTGSARSAAEAATPLIITTAAGVRVGQLAYSFNFNGHEPAAGQSWEANLTDVPTILAAAHRLRQAGADVIVLSLHWGTEYDHLATDLQRSQAAALLASPDVDLILGDHAHVVQPAQKIDGKWVFYCMGNQISRHEDPVAEGREGVMPLVTFTRGVDGRYRVSRAEAIPTWMQDSPALRLVDLPRSLATPAGLTAAQSAEQQAAHRDIARYLDAYGATEDGLTIR